MSEESESLSISHSANLEVEYYKDSDYAFAIDLDVILRGWHQGKVAMKGKESLRDCEKRNNLSGVVPGLAACLAKGWHEVQKKDRREYNSDPKGSIPIKYSTALFC